MRKDKYQKTFLEFEGFKEFSIYHQLGMAEAKRQGLFNELLENLSQYNENTYSDIQNKERLCKIYMYETRKIAEQIRELRQLILRK